MNLENGVYGPFKFKITLTISKHFVISFEYVWNESRVSLLWEWWVNFVSF